ncbi:hypothetical protein ACMXYV_08335 [Neptuniibacter sp. SY11_33]|uniref:hypothetical protein n=1 Tax=Neptuniibacter sp. SY11_33 TaxID=3398215 RepID=UPI0039F56576
MVKVVSFIFSILFSFSSVTAQAQDVDFSKPEKVAMSFLVLLQTGDFESIQTIVIEEDLRFFSAEKLEKVRRRVQIPEEIKLSVKYSENGKRAGVAVEGTKIGLELRLVNGRWLMEH